MTNPKRSRDPNQLAKLIVDIATGEVKDCDPDKGKDPAAVALGRKGGLKGGVSRMAALTEEERKELAAHAANARWKKAAPANKTGAAKVPSAKQD